jgi:hypothetical protein
VQSNDPKQFPVSSALTYLQHNQCKLHSVHPALLCSVL